MSRDSEKGRIRLLRFARSVSDELTLYEEKYGILSEDFYSAIMSGKLADYDAYDETRADFSRWKGIYGTLQRRKATYRKQLEGQELAKVIRFQPVY